MSRVVARTWFYIYSIVNIRFVMIKFYVVRGWGLVVVDWFFINIKQFVLITLGDQTKKRSNV
jgi:hypothetical protein